MNTHSTKDPARPAAGTQNSATDGNRMKHGFAPIIVKSLGGALGLLASFALLGSVLYSQERLIDSKAPVQVVIRAEAAATLAADDKPAAGTGTFKGVVTFKGTPPAPRRVLEKNDPKIEQPADRALCAADEYFSDELLVNEKAANGVANVIVYLAKAPPDYTPPPVPEEPVVFDQKGCRFFPHVLVIRCNQKMLIKSDDPVVHNTRITPVRNTGFNQTISPKNREGMEFIYKKPEGLPTPVKCDLHKWMTAYQLPLEHPLAAVTDAEGKFEIKGLPPGKHTFIVWHEMSGYLSFPKSATADKRKLEVEIKADKVAEEKLSYTAAEFIKP